MKDFDCYLEFQRHLTKGETHEFESHSLDHAFLPNRFLVMKGGRDVDVIDFFIDGHAQFLNANDIPGEVFSPTSIDPEIRFIKLNPGKTLRVKVRAKRDTNFEVEIRGKRCTTSW